MVWEFERIKTPTSLNIAIVVCVSSIVTYVCYLLCIFISPPIYYYALCLLKPPPLTNLATPLATAGTVLIYLYGITGDFDCVLCVSVYKTTLYHTLSITTTTVCSTT